MIDNADEVCEKGANACSDVESDNDLLLSGSLDEANTVVTGHNSILLVEEHEVAGGPDSLKGNSDDNKEARDKEFTSAVFIILSEENNNERRCNYKGSSEHNTDKDEPPVDVIVQELIEDLQENEEGKG